MSGVIVLHFWSPTCAPCKVIKPAIEDIQEEFLDRIDEWISVNTKDDPKGLSSFFRVAIVPTIVVVKNGEEVGRHSGTQVAIYYALIRKALST